MKRVPVPMGKKNAWKNIASKKCVILIFWYQSLGVDLGLNQRMKQVLKSIFRKGLLANENFAPLLTIKSRFIYSSIKMLVLNTKLISSIKAMIK